MCILLNQECRSAPDRRRWHGLVLAFCTKNQLFAVSCNGSPTSWGRACPLVGIVPVDTPSTLVAMLPQKWRKGLVCHAHKCARLQGTLLYHAPIGQMHGCKGGNILRHKCRKIPSKMGKSIITTSGYGHRCSLLPYHPQKWGRTAPFFRRFLAVLPQVAKNSTYKHFGCAILA